MVAAVALASSTYAWFVSNNSVKATTTNISAQSNSPFLVIYTKATSDTSTGAVTATGNNKPLYPAQVVDNGVWESAYASDTSAATERADSRFTIGDGTASKAVAGAYAINNTFYIGTRAGDFTDLKITGVTVNDAGTSDLDNALRVLVVVGDNWCVWKAGTTAPETITGTATNGILATNVNNGTDVTVQVYVYYDGAEQEVYTDNLESLTSVGATITFEATPVNIGETTGA